MMRHLLYIIGAGLAAHVTLLTSTANLPPSIVMGTSFRIYSSDDQTLTFEDRLGADAPLLQLSEHAAYVANLTAQNLEIASSKEWILLSDDTFSNYDDAQHWTISNNANAPLGTCANSIDVFLGGPCQFGTGTKATRTFDSVPSWARLLKVTGRLHFFDRWEGESLTILVDGVPRYSKSYSWCPSGYQSTCLKQHINVCGADEGDKLSEHFSLVIPHTDGPSSMTLSIAVDETGSFKEPCDMSWAIDDVKLWALI